MATHLASVAQITASNGVAGLIRMNRFIRGNSANEICKQSASHSVLVERLGRFHISASLAPYIPRKEAREHDRRLVHAIMRFDDGDPRLGKATAEAEA